MGSIARREQCGLSAESAKTAKWRAGSGTTREQRGSVASNDVKLVSNGVATIETYV